MLHVRLLLFFISLFFSAISHILIPPFLPDGYQKQYYEQKFRISQLDTATFKITGLPKDVFWTSNGTIFGTPSNFGQWTINIAYDALTESGSYETLLTIKRPNVKRDISQVNDQQTRSLQIIFPESLVFEKSNPQQIQFIVKNAIAPVQWIFTTLPKGVSQNQNGKLQVKIQKEGIYILRLQVIDYAYNQIQACVSLNVQTSKRSFIESYAPTTIYEPSQNVNRLLQITKKDSQITKQLNLAAMKLGEQGKILKDNQQLFQKVTNNLIQLQNQAKYASNLIQNTIRDKRNQQKKLKEALDIVRNAEEGINLALIQQISNNNLLKESTSEKAKAQLTYDKAAKDSENQAQVVKNLQTKLSQKQQEKFNNVGLLSQAKSKYLELGAQIMSKENQLILLNDSLKKASQEVVNSDVSVKTQNANLSQQERKYATIENGLKLIDSKIQTIQAEIQDLTSQRSKITDQIMSLDLRLKNMELNDLFSLQNDIQNNGLAIQTLLFDAVKDWNTIQYQSTFVQDQLAQVKFGGCGQAKYPKVEGVFKIQSIENSASYLVSESGNRILYGNCTVKDDIKVGQSIKLSGYVFQGVIHANKIERV